MNTYTWGSLPPSHTLVTPRSWQTYREERRPKMTSATSKVKGLTLQRSPLTPPGHGQAKSHHYHLLLWMLRRKPTDLRISEYPQFIKDYGFEFIHAGDTNTNMLKLNFCNNIWLLVHVFITCAIKQLLFFIQICFQHFLNDFLNNIKNTCIMILLSSPI